MTVLPKKQMQLPDYQLVQEQCNSLPQPVDASGVQGAVSAMLAVDSTITLTSILRQYGDGELAGNRLQQHPRLVEHIEQIYAVVHYWLNETEFDFALFLPDDSQPVRTRLRSMACWCDDFLHAFGIAQANKRRQTGKDVRQLLATFAELGRVDWYHSETDEQSEFDFQQLVEFIRMAVVDIHSDYHSATPVAVNPAQYQAVCSPDTSDDG